LECHVFKHAVSKNHGHLDDASRIRLVFHAHNSREEIDALVAAIGYWASEMIEISQSGNKSSLPSAARKVNSTQLTRQS
jgi:hypothetical protein